MNSAVEVKNVRMVFNLMEENVDTLKEYVMRLLKGKLFYNEFVSLDNISFTVEKGDILGIVGFNGAGKSILGYSRKFLKSNFDRIIEFAELENFKDVPIKNFSSGMYARLGFAIATIVNPDILIVDEVLSVGDYKFKEKCTKRIKEMIEQGTTIIIVSHEIEMIEEVCNKVLWLEHGRIRGFGDTDKICCQYKVS